MKTVIVTGGRDFNDVDHVVDVLVLIKATLWPETVHLVHGGARGLDSIAGKVAKVLRMQVTEVPAKWDEHGKRAGVLRNLEMLQAHPDAWVLHFPGGRGTKHCKEAAEQRGMSVASSHAVLNVWTDIHGP